MLQEQIAITNNVVKFSFSLANLAASQTNTDIPVLGGEHTTYQMISDGFIIGYSFNKSVDHSAGSFDFDINVGGSSTLTVEADTTGVYKVIPSGNEPFNAGDTLGVDYTSDGSLSPTTVDAVVDIYVVFTGQRF